MENYIDILKKADKWFALHDIGTFIQNDKMYIDIGEFELELSKDEVEYRERLYDKVINQKK
tara:strand:- start:622 stop:804 length:183 start_codon:yes stop_codon:yes gene_type:complete